MFELECHLVNKKNEKRFKIAIGINTLSLLLIII